MSPRLLVLLMSIALILTVSCDDGSSSSEEELSQDISDTNDDAGPEGDQR